MKALIAKNENFETVGFEVTANGSRIISWGIHPDTAFNFVKEANTKEYITEIFALVRLQQELHDEENLFRACFEAIHDSEDLKGFDGAVNFSKNRERITNLKSQISNIIANIK